jgi:hypothetical protein
MRAASPAGPADVSVKSCAAGSSTANPEASSSSSSAAAATGCSSASDSEKKNFSAEVPTLERLAKVVQDENAPIAQRTRAVFLLRQLGSNAAVDALVPVLK